MEIMNEVPGLIGIILAVVVLVTVYIMKVSKLVVKPDHARAANILLSMFLTYQTQDIKETESTLVFVVSALLSSFAHMFFEWLNERKKNQA